MHWHALEAAEYAAVLCDAGHAVTPFSDSRAGDALKRVRHDPPEAFVLVLDRLPSHGRAVAQWLRETKATRQVPLVFVGGEAAKVEQIRALLPDATYTTWPQLEKDLEAAIRNAPTATVRPNGARRSRNAGSREPRAADRPGGDQPGQGGLAGYSATPLVRKLGIKAGSAVLLLGAPGAFETMLGTLPPDVSLRRQARSKGDVVLLFALSVADLEKRFPAATRALSPGGRLWLAWRKKAAGSSTDLGESQVRAFGLQHGFVDYKICAIDPTWSGLCFSRRTAPSSRSA